MTFVTAKLLGVTAHSEALWPALAFLGCVVAVYIVYRFASDRLSRLLFPESVQSQWRQNFERHRSSNKQIL